MPRLMDTTVEAFGPVPEDIISTLVPTLIADLKRSREAGHIDAVADTVHELERILRQPIPEQ